MKNHNTKFYSINVSSSLVSRRRVRIPTRSLRHLNIMPGQRVNISRDSKGNIFVVPNNKGNYKVERDGSVRFSANVFNVRRLNFESTSDRITNSILVA